MNSIDYSCKKSMRSTFDIKSVIKILGQLLAVEAVMTLAPLGVSLLYGESDWKAFGVSSCIAAIASTPLLLLTRHVKTVVRMREGFVITAFIWIVYGLFGMIPFILGSSHLGFTDAFFETISGFTTTGMSVISDVSSQSHGILFWRALTQWIGGLGIILFLLAIIPELNRSDGLLMFNAETSGFTIEKLHPRIRQTVLSLWGVYIVVTVISIILLWLGPMDLFDSVCQTFAAIATGGFSTHNEGVSYWHSNYVLGVLTGVMFAGGINFMVLYAAWKKGLGVILRNEVTRIFIFTVFLTYLLFLLSALFRGEEPGIDNYLFFPLFHVVSAISSTGFTIVEAENWGPFALFLTILLMLCGSCAGSTAGGIKIDRLIVLGRNLKNEIKRCIYPKRVYVVNLNGSFLQNSLITRVSAFVSLYMLVVLAITGVIAFHGYSFTDSLFMVCSSMGCNGLGYGATGINGSFAALPGLVKWVLTIGMLIGRLELFTFIVLFLPSVWRR